MGPGEQQRRKVERQRQRRLEPARQPAERHAAAEQRRQRQFDARQDLGQPDGGHGQHQPGGPEEPLDDQPVGQRPDQGRDHDADGEGGVVVPAPVLEQLGGQHPGRRPQRRLGEVHDPAGPIDQHEAHGRQPGQRPEDDALEDDARREAHCAAGAGIGAGGAWSGHDAPRNRRPPLRVIHRPGLLLKAEMALRS